MINDDDLQKSIESGNGFSGDDLDAKAYQEVFTRLRKKPDAYLSPDFADKVIVRIQDQHKKSTSRDFFWLISGVVLLTIALVTAVFLSGFHPSLGFLKGMSAYAGLFVFGLAFILFLNGLDKKLLQKADFEKH